MLVSESVNRSLLSASLFHGFSLEDEMRRQSLLVEGVGVGVGVVGKKGKGKSLVSDCPLPFVVGSGSGSGSGGCGALCYNRGLFTACENDVGAEVAEGVEVFCGSCQKDISKNESGLPSCGTVKSRESVGLYEFKDPKGRRPTHYMKVLDKMKVTQEEAMAAAEKLNIVIDPVHFGASVVSRGRPKKVKVAEVSSANVTDLFAKLTAEPIAPSVETPSVEIVAEDKVNKKAALELERLAKKQERAEKMAQELKERKDKRACAEAAKEAKSLEKKSAKEAKSLEKKSAKEAKAPADAIDTKAPADADAIDTKAPADAIAPADADDTKAPADAIDTKAPADAIDTKAPADADAIDTKAPADAIDTKAPADAIDTKGPADAIAPAATETKKVHVKKIYIEEVEYLLSISNNLLYNSKTKEAIGLWDSATNTIKELPEEEEEEEEYEESDEECE